MRHIPPWANSLVDLYNSCDYCIDAGSTIDATFTEFMELAEGKVVEWCTMDVSDGAMIFMRIRRV